MKRLKIVIFFAGGFLLAGLSLCAQPSRNQLSGKALPRAGSPARRPNIIFILTDDQGYGDLGVFFQNQRALANDRSKPCERSPNLDRLAAGGAMLTQHYAAAPVCAPSRTSILSGLSQGHANVRDNQFDKAIEDNYNMASTLRDRGYATAAIGKWGLQGLDGTPPDWPAHPLRRGFDYFFGYMRHSDGHEHYPKEGLYDGPKEVWENYTSVAAGLDKCYTADLWTAAAKKYITAHAGGKEAGKPFFLYLAYETPHAVLELPTQPYPAGGGLHGGIQWIGDAGHMINTASGTPDSWEHPDYAHATYDDDNNPATPEIPWPDTYKRYATANRRIDDGVGDLMLLLKELKIDSNTLIVYTSDNGPSIESYLPKGYVSNRPDFFDSFGPFDGIKRDNWEGGMRMPTIASWPGHIPAGITVTDPSISYDWAPTFLDVTGMPAPARMDGVSLLPSLTGAGRQRESLVYSEYYFPGNTPDFKAFAPGHRGRLRNQMQSVRLGDYVGVRYNIKSKDDDFEIYDVVKDPGERYNLAAGAGDAATGVAPGRLQQEMKDLVLQVRRPDTSAPRPYDTVLVPALAEKGKITSGIGWKEYSGAFPWLPQVTGLSPALTGRAESPGVPAGKYKNGVLYFYGYIRVPEDGDYGFYLKTDGEALLRIHDATVMETDSRHMKTGSRRIETDSRHIETGNGHIEKNEITATIKLKAGLHPFRLYYRKGSLKGPSGPERHSPGQSSAGQPPLTVEWSGPGILRQPVPASVFFMDREK